MINEKKLAKLLIQLANNSYELKEAIDDHGHMKDGTVVNTNYGKTVEKK